MQRQSFLLAAILLFTVQLTGQDLTLMASITVSRSGAQGFSYASLPYGWVTSSTLSLSRNGGVVDYNYGSSWISGASVYLSVGDSSNPPANTLFELFAEAVGELSDYGYFIRTQYQYGLTPPPSVAVSGSSGAMDGGTGWFLVSTEGGNALDYQWLYSAPADADNNPGVVFNSSGASTLTDAHWFALPRGQVCANASSVYTIRGRALVDGGWYEGTAPYEVALPGKGGEVWSPIVSGAVDLQRDLNGTYRVSGNRLGRTQPQRWIYLDAASQFYSKISQHENVHMTQFTTGIFATYWAPSTAYARVQGLTDATEVDLLKRVQAEVVAYNSEQDALARPVMQTAGESEAYDLSDSIPPLFFYQRSCRQ